MISTFIVSFSVLPVLAQPDNDPTEEGTHISWETDHQSEADSSDWRSLTWEFGPYPRYVILLANGTMVTDFNFIPVGEDFSIIINVKKEIFQADHILGGVAINFHMELVNQTSSLDHLGWADARMEYVNYVIGEAVEWMPKNGTWAVWSQIYNRTKEALEVPKIQFGGEDDGEVYAVLPIEMVIRLTSTSLWDQSTPDQTLPRDGTVSTTPGVHVGDWGLYDVNVYVPHYDPATYYGPKNETVRMDVIAIDGSNVSFTLTNEIAPDPQLPLNIHN